MEHLERDDLDIACKTRQELHDILMETLGNYVESKVMEFDYDGDSVIDYDTSIFGDYSPIKPPSFQYSKKPKIPRIISSINVAIVDLDPTVDYCARNFMYHPILMNATTKDISIFLHRIEKTGTVYRKYDPTFIFKIVFNDHRATYTSNAIKVKVEELSKLETTMISGIIGLTPSSVVEIPSNVYYCLESIRECHKLSVEIMNQKVYKGDKKTTNARFHTGQWVRHLNLCGTRVLIFKGINISYICYGHDIYYGPSSIVNHMYTVLCISFTYKMLEGNSHSRFQQLLSTYRNNVFRTLDYRMILKVNRDTEPFCKALCDLHGCHGTDFTIHALTTMASHYNLPVNKFITEIFTKEEKNDNLNWIRNLLELGPYRIMTFSQYHKVGTYSIYNLKDSLDKAIRRTTRYKKVDSLTQRRLVSFAVYNMCKAHVLDFNNHSLPTLINVETKDSPQYNHTSERILKLYSAFSRLDHHSFFKAWSNPILWMGINVYMINPIRKTYLISDVLNSKRAHTGNMEFHHAKMMDESQCFEDRKEGNTSPDVDRFLLNLKEFHDSGKWNLDLYHGICFDDWPEKLKEIIEDHSMMYATMTAKEKEQGDMARFFQTTTFEIKKCLAVLGKEQQSLLEYLPGQVMKMSEEVRKRKQGEFGRKTTDQLYNEYLQSQADIEGHTSSYRYESSYYWVQMFANALGRPNFQYIHMVYIMMISTIRIPGTKCYYFMVYQKGGIEGWLLYLHGAHTACAGKYFLWTNQLGGDSQSYGDDLALQFLKQLRLTLNYMMKMLIEFFESLSQRLNPLETSFSDIRFTHLRNSVVAGVTIDLYGKRLLKTTPQTDSTLVNEALIMDSVSSSTASALASCSNHWIPTMIKWAYTTIFSCGVIYSSYRSKLKHTKDKDKALLYLPKSCRLAVQYIDQPEDNFMKKIKVLQNDVPTKLFGTEFSVSGSPRLDIMKITLMETLEIITPKEFFSRIFENSDVYYMILKTVSANFLFDYATMKETNGGLGVNPLLTSLISGYSYAFLDVLQLQLKYTRSEILSKLFSGVASKKLSLSEIYRSQYPFNLGYMNLKGLLMREMRKDPNVEYDNPDLMKCTKYAKNHYTYLLILTSYVRSWFPQRIMQKISGDLPSVIGEEILDSVLSIGGITRKIDFNPIVIKSICSIIRNNYSKLMELGECDLPTDSRDWIIANLIKNKPIHIQEFFIVHEPGIVNILGKASQVGEIMVKINPFRTATGELYPPFRRNTIKPKYQKFGPYLECIKDVYSRKAMDLIRFMAWIRQLFGNVDYAIHNACRAALSLYGLIDIDEFLSKIPPVLGGELYHRVDNRGFKAGTMILCYQTMSGSISTLFTRDYWDLTRGVDSNINQALINGGVIISVLCSQDKPINVPKIFYVTLNQSNLHHIVDVHNIDITGGFKVVFEPLETLVDCSNLLYEQEAIDYAHYVLEGPTYASFNTMRIAQKNVMPSIDDIETAAAYCKFIVEQEYRLDASEASDEVLKSVLNDANFKGAKRSVINMYRSTRFKMLTYSDAASLCILNNLSSLVDEDFITEYEINHLLTTTTQISIYKLIIKHHLIVAQCQVHSLSPCLAVDWIKSKQNSEYLKVDEIVIYLGNMYSASLVNNAIDNLALKFSGISCQQLAQSVPDMISSQKEKIILPDLEEDKYVEYEVKVSDIITYQVLDRVSKDLESIRYSAMAFAPAPCYYRVAVSIWKYLFSRRYLEPGSTSIDATAGIGTFKYAFDIYMGECKDELSECYSYTPPDYYLKNGVYQGTSIIEKYNLLSSRTWDQPFQLADVIIIDTNDLDTMGCVAGDVIFPETTKTLVIRYNPGTVNKLKQNSLHFEATFPYVKIVMFNPSFRYTYIICSKVEYRDGLNPDLLFKLQNQAIYHDRWTDSITERSVYSQNEFISIVKKCQQDISNEADFDPLSQDEILEKVAVLREGLDRSIPLERILQDIKKKPAKFTSQQIKYMHELDDASITTEARYQALLTMDIGKIRIAVVWVMRAKTVSSGIPPVNYYILRIGSMRKITRRDLSMIYHIRRVQNYVKLKVSGNILFGVKAIATGSSQRKIFTKLSNNAVPLDDRYNELSNLIDNALGLDRSQEMDYEEEEATLTTEQKEAFTMVLGNFAGF
jgi:hypothetical protein